MKKVLASLGILVILGLVLAACTNPMDAVNGENGARASATVSYKSIGSTTVPAVNIAEVKSSQFKGDNDSTFKNAATKTGGIGIAQSGSSYKKVYNYSPNPSGLTITGDNKPFVITYGGSIINLKYDGNKNSYTIDFISSGTWLFYFVNSDGNNEWYEVTVTGDAGQQLVSKKDIQQVIVVGVATSGPLAAQNFDFTEAAGVDFPNPDRGFYRANDGNVVPVTGNGSLETSGANVTSIAYIGSTASTRTPVSTRVMQIYFDLRNFSNNMMATNTFTANWIQTYARGQNRTQILAAYRAWYAEQPKNETRPLTDAALAFIRRGFQAARDGNAVIIPRFNYDGMGWSYMDGRLNNGTSNITFDDLLFNCEPDKDTMLMHIAQLKEIFYEYEDVIMHVDGGFFGPWGEMHSSTFGTSTAAYAWLMEALLDAVPPSRTISGHLGSFLSWYNWKYGTRYTFSNVDTMPAPQPGTPEARFGFFNDSYAFGAETSRDPADDWGSLSEGESYVGGTFNRGKVINWIRKQGNNYGGEAQDDGTRTAWNRFPYIGWEASVAHTSYMNLDYDSAVHNGWNGFTYNEAPVLATFTNGYSVDGGPVVNQAIYDPVYAGKKGGEYMRDRLGYRLVLREASASEWVKSRVGTLSFEGKIQNVGWGNVVNFKNVYVILKNAAGSYTVLTDLDARNWKCALDNRPTNVGAWSDLNFSINMSEFGTVPPGVYGIYLKIQDPLEKSVNKRAIQFANNGTGIWDEALGANLIGLTTVK